jgi:hypothetical protein
MLTRIALLPALAKARSSARWIRLTSRGCTTRSTAALGSLRERSTATSHRASTSFTAASSASTVV